MRPSARTIRLIQLLVMAAAIVGVVPHARGGAKYKVLHNFGSSGDGSIPYGPPILDGNGNVYGVTIDGGSGQCSDYGCGTVFELMPQSNGKWTEQILHGFTGGSGGAFPDGDLIFDAAGNLYGTAGGYGSADAGGVFALTPVSANWSFTFLYGQEAGPGLIMDKAGNLYGAIGPGNYFGIGAIGELSPGSNAWTYIDLANFNPIVGYAPPAPPIWDGHGNLYGVTSKGGISQPACWTAEGCGVIFKMTPNQDGTWTYHILHRFASFATDGQSPYGGLVMDASGSFYGTTWFGGAHNNGTVFKFSFSGGSWKKTVLYDFPNCAYGCLAEGTLAFDKAGNLYGTANGGQGNCGGYTCGVVFKLAPQAGGKWKYSVVHNFTAAGGGFPPFYGVILDDKGNLYGTTSAFGRYHRGTAFEIILGAITRTTLGTHPRDRTVAPRTERGKLDSAATRATNGR